jgi:hypothetical protein
MDLNDVELTDADEGRVDRLVDRTSFGQTEAEAVVRFSKVDKSDRDPAQIRSFVSDGNPDNGQYYVEDGLTPDECDRIRRNMGKASRPKTIIDAWPDKHPSVIFRHATGRCDHDGDRDPVTSPRIEPDECREMRVDFQTGDTVEDIRAEYNRSAKAVVKHVFGRCGHTFEHKRNGRELSESLCRRMRRAYRENDTAAIADIGSAFIIGTSTAHRHLTGKCGHRDGVEAPIGSNGSARIDEDECELFRAAYGSGTSPQDLADPFDRDVSAVRKHLFGRCRHDDVAFEPDRRSVPPGLCKAIRHEYRTRGVDSVASVINRLDVTKGTFYYHLNGRCGHDHDVDPADHSGSEV